MLDNADWLLLGCAIAGGIGYFLAKPIVEERIPPLQAASLRFLIAGLGFALSSPMWASGTVPDRQTTWMLFWMAFFGVLLFNLCLFKMLEYLPSTYAALSGPLNPSIAFALTIIFLHERVTPPRLLGIPVTLFGALVALSGGKVLTFIRAGFGRGVWWLFGAATSWACYLVLSEAIGTRLGNIEKAAYSSWIGFALICVTIGFFQRKWAPISIRAGWGIAYLGLVGTTILFIALHTAIGWAGSTRASAWMTTMPIFSMICTSLSKRIPLSLSTSCGSFIMLCGVLMIKS